MKVLTIFDFFAGYLRLTTELIKTVWPFVILFGVIILMFSNVMYIFYSRYINTKHENEIKEHGEDAKAYFLVQTEMLIDTLFSNYLLAIGDFDRNNFYFNETSWDFYIYVIFISGSLLSNFVVINLMIALAGDVFDRMSMEN